MSRFVMNRKAIRTRLMKLRLFYLFLAVGLFAGHTNSFSQIAVTSATGGLNICTNTAVNGSAPGPTTLNVIIVRESANADIQTGADTLVLKPPTGWRFWWGTT